MHFISYPASTITRWLSHLAFAILCCHAINLPPVTGQEATAAASLTANFPAAPLVDAQTLAVARIQPQKLDLARLGIRLRSLFPSGRTAITKWLVSAEQLQSQFEEADISELFVILSTHTGPGYRPIFCLPLSDQVTASQVEKWLPEAWKSEYEIRKFASSWIAAPEPTFDRLQTYAKYANAEDAKMREAVLDQLFGGEESVRLAAGLSADHRRAIREREIQLPDWLGGGFAAEVLAPVELLTLSGESQEQTSLRLSATSTSEADVVRGILHRVLIAALTHINVPEIEARQFAQTLQTTNRIVELELSTAGQAFASFVEGIAPALDSQLLALAKAQAMQQMRSICIQILNHHGAYKFLPPAGGIEKNENFKGSFSWRVHILPFLGDAEAELYRQFKLNEDWDSQHNRQFIAKMPAVFLMPNSSLTIEQGRSNFCVPTGEDTMWPRDKIITFDDITDGTANTISVLEVRDELAQIWTKAEPFIVDPQRLDEQLGGHFGSEFLVSFANGAMGFRSLGIDPKQFTSMLTRNAGD